MWLFRSILLELQKEQPELFSPENVEMLRQMLEEGVRQEIAWGHYVIGDAVPGLTSRMVTDYIRYLGNLRWSSLGFGTLFEGCEREPADMAWVSQYSNANMVKTDFLRPRALLMPKARRWWTTCKQNALKAVNFSRKCATIKQESYAAKEGRNHMAKTGLVLEGGGMRGVFTAGVLDFFWKKG